MLATSLGKEGEMTKKVHVCMNIRNYLQKGNSDYHIDFLAEHSLVTRFIMDGPSNRNTKYQ